MLYSRDRVVMYVGPGTVTTFVSVLGDIKLGDQTSTSQEQRLNNRERSMICLRFCLESELY